MCFPAGKRGVTLVQNVSLPSNGSYTVPSDRYGGCQDGPPLSARVLAVTALPAPETLPAASRALTVNVYEVLAASPPTVAFGLFTVDTLAVPAKTSYPVTPTLSVDAFQA